MTVGKKLWVGFLAILSIVLLVGASGLWALSKLDGEYRYLIDDKINNVVLLEQLLSAQHADAKNIRGYIIYKDQLYVEQRNEIMDAIKTKIKMLDQSTHTTSARQIMKEVKETSKSAEQISELIIRDVQAGNIESAMDLAKEVSFYQEEVSVNLQQLIQQQEAEQEHTEEQLQTVLKWIYADWGLDRHCGRDKYHDCPNHQPQYCSTSSEDDGFPYTNSKRRFNSWADYCTKQR